LQQVLVNLLANAIKFTDHGEVELRIDLTYTENNQENLRFTVRDTGIGIPYDKQTEIFSLFTQADSSITRRFGGSGLGLAISRQLVELMGGKLKLTSEEGVGSEFSFELPLQRTSNLDMSKSQLVALNLLVADDSDIARAALTTIIQSLGWQADAVASGDEALSHWSAQPSDANGYDVVLLDWQMPDPDGLATARLMREALGNQAVQSTRTPIIIMVTSADRESILARPESKYVDEILSKPLTASTLYNSVAELIGKNQFHLQSQASNVELNPLLTIPGLRILVVDDCEINREVAQLLLSNYGAVVNLAVDGQEALNWMNANPESVDIILMDVQMPVLDGYSATRILRKDPRWQNLPIIALSAGVFKEDVEMACAAGMDDFISKPFNVNQLLTTIQRLMGNEANPHTLDSSIPATELPPTDQLTEQPSDADFSKMAIEWGNIDVYRRYLGQFVENYATCGDSIAKLIAEDNDSGAAALTHKLKGAAGSLGLKNVAAQALMVEGIIRQGNFSGTEIEPLQSSIDQAWAAIADWLPGKATAQTKDGKLSSSTASNEELIELLQQLLHALDQDNPTIAKPVLSKLQDIIPQKLYANIQAQLALYDFRAAEALTLATLNNILDNSNHT
jgi:CheY-like chemotaxis protein/HPt (histidine-containing phosphotransfer) domain-containing protein